MMKYLVPILALSVIGCAKSESVNSYSQPLKTVRVTKNGGELSVDITPKAEILFVMDNSGSMSAHIRKVRRNLSKFVNEFSRNNPFEYNLGIVYMLQCNGKESSISDCEGFSTHGSYCSHSDDVYLQCLPGKSLYIPSRLMVDLMKSSNSIQDLFMGVTHFFLA